MRAESTEISSGPAVRQSISVHAKERTVDEVAVMFQNCVGIGTEFFIRAILAEVSPFDSPRTIFKPNSQGKLTEYCDVPLQIDIANGAKKRIATSGRYKKRVVELSEKIDAMIAARLVSQPKDA